MNPLQVASLKGHLEVVKEILIHGAKPNLTYHNEKTALHMASEEGYPEIVKELLKYGANPNLKDHNGDTPLDIANKQDGEIKEELLKWFGMASELNADENTRMELALKESKDEFKD